MTASLRLKPALAFDTVVAASNPCRDESRHGRRERPRHAGRNAGYLLLLFASLLMGDGFDSSGWQFVLPVRVAEAGRMCTIPFERPLYSRMRHDLGDLRILKDGEQIPYVIETMSGSLEESECRPAILNQSAAPDAGVQITLDLARCSAEPRHSRLRIATQRTNFRQKVRVESSDDNRYWVLAREDGYIFDFTQDDRKLSVLTVDYPVSTRRYVRATIFGWTSPGDVTGAWSGYRVERPPERTIIDANSPLRSEDRSTRTSLLTLDLGQSGLPHDRIRLEAGQSGFHRAAQLEASDDGKAWVLAAQGTVFEVPDEQSLSLTYTKRYERYLRLRIFNGDNQPVPILRVYVETPKQVVKFLPPSAGDISLYYGNPGASPPIYDLAAILGRQAPIPETKPILGEWGTNPGYKAPAQAVKPWSDRHPALLYGVLAVAVICMGLLTVLFFIQVRGA
jgi:hypothetical protein